MGFNFPNAPTDGTIFTPPGGPAYTFTGGVWIGSGAAGGGSASITVSDTPPADPKAGALWYESDTGNTFIFYDDLSSQQWVQINTGGVQQAIATDAPSDGRFYSRRNGVWALGTAEARNRAVNGAFQHSQENGRVAGATNFYYAADQWLMSFAGISGATFASVAPTSSADGYLQLSFGTAKPSLAAGDIAAIETRIEGVRMADFRWGTATALPIVIRFEAFVAAGGTYTVAINNSGGARCYLKSFVLPANQWTTVTLAVPGDTSGTWLVDTGMGMSIDFTFAAGTTYQAAGDTWQAGGKYAVTGTSNAAASVQNVFVKNVGLYLDPNNTGLPPSWQAPDYADELTACRRYWWCSNPTAPKGTSAYGQLTGHSLVAGYLGLGNWRFTVPMRIIPTISLWSAGTQNQIRNIASGAYLATGAITSQANFSTEGGSNMNVTTATASIWWDFDLQASARM